MADEANDALIPEAPSPEAAAPQQEAPAHDPYEKRYADLRSEFDRRNSLLDRARSGDINAIRELGFDVDEPEPEPEPEYEDPYASKLSEYDKKIAEFEAWKAEREAERLAEGVGSQIERLASQSDVALTDDDKTLIFQRAVAGGNPNAEGIEAAFKAHLDYRNAIINAEKESWIQSKRTPRLGAGQAASKQPDLDNPQAQAEYIDAALADLELD